MEPCPLTRRQIECLQWVSVGKTMTEIAAIIGISASTVGHHLADAQARLGASNGSQTIAVALRKGWIA